MKQLALTLPGSSTGQAGETLTAPSGIPKALQGGLDTAGQSIFQTGTNLIFTIAIFLAVIVIMYSGIQWLISEGNPEKVASARKRLMSAVIGLVIVALSFFIVNVLTTILGGKTGNFFSPGQILK